MFAAPPFACFVLRIASQSAGKLVARLSHAVAAALWATALAGSTWAQAPPPTPSPPSNASPQNSDGTRGAAGGGAQADFDSLIDLITSTIEQESWLDNGTGEGQIMPFAINGVAIDAQRNLHLVAGDRPISRPPRLVPSPVRRATSGRDARDVTGSKAAARRAPAASVADANNANKANSDHNANSAEKDADAGDPRRSSAVRVVSLKQLELAIAARLRGRQPLVEEMLTLAGLRRMRWVVVDEARGDLLLAWPAGDWVAERGGALLASDTRQPLVRLDDLLAVWRRERMHRGAAFGCSIVPRQEALHRAQDYLAASAGAPIDPQNRGAWLQGLRDAVGEQDVEFYQVDPDSRMAGVLLAADYHMKLIGLGLVPGVKGVRSYLSTVKLLPDGTAPPMAVLRWWFAVRPMQVEVDAERTTYLLPESACMQTLSENELLAARGQRVHTGASDALNRQFADSFTAHFEALSAAYPIYGELERLGELALVAALLEREGLAERAGWTPRLLCDAERLRLPRMNVPRSVETVVQHRVLAGRQILAGVSGGVWVDAAQPVDVVETPTATARASRQRITESRAEKDAEATAPWWWDAADEPSKTSE